MAVRLTNLMRLPLRVDLRGGGVLVLAPGARSAALREEDLYDNHHIDDWERAGWLLREPASMKDVPPQPQAFAAPPAAEEAPAGADEAAAPADGADAGGAAPAEAGEPQPAPAAPATGRAGSKSGKR